jgi:transposase-like protein
VREAGLDRLDNARRAVGDDKERIKAPRSASATLDGIETAHMIRKEQLGAGCPFAIYAGLAE